MLIELILITLGSYLLEVAVIEGLVWVFGLRGDGLPEGCDEWLKDVPLTEEDHSIGERSQNMLKDFFPDGNIGEKMLSLSREDRVRLMLRIVEEAADIFDVDIETADFMPSSLIGPFTYGYFDHSNKAIVFNKDMVCCDEIEVLEHLIKTIFHELRHAQQYRAVTDKNYNFGSEEQRYLWGLNFMEGHYISPEVDFDKYQEQAIETDARAMANICVLDLVCPNNP